MKKTIALLLAVPLALSGLAAAETPDPLRLIAVNVGKADALLLFSGSDVYLIDTGTAESWGALSAALRANGVTALTGVILTHTDKDHIGGLEALACSSIPVGAWYTSAFCAKEFKDGHPADIAAASRNQEAARLKSGDSLPLDRGTLTVLGPTASSDKENCNSVVLLAEGGGGSMLLAGDMEFPEEEALMAAGLIGGVDVLKVGNHGESDATSDAFAALAAPKIAVISTNSVEEPDTPAKRVVKALKRAGAQLAFTESASGGVEVSLAGGEAKAYLVSWEYPEEARGVVISGKSGQTDTISLTNTGSAAVDLSGWFIRSERGGQVFVFPEGASLDSGKSLTVSALDSPSAGDYVWRDKKVWHKSKDDAASLYDAWGRLMAEAD
ncbi:MAG: lamin tail domain-containing protein [Clostridia bacterium]|nr:lamin tail domain-containing protein [Clostridia bacterium]